MRAICTDKGLTFVELLVALMLFAIVAGGIGYSVMMVVPTQRAYHMNVMANDIYKLSYLFKKDLLSAFDVLTPAWPSGNSASFAATLVMSVSDNSTSTGVKHVEYKSVGTQVQRCEKPCSNMACTSVTCNAGDFEDILSEWDDGYVGLIASGSGVWRGVDADGNGALSDREKNMIRIVLVLGQFEGVSGSENEVARKTFVIEVLQGTPGRN
jgi:prepilin-type N-terminal cleavage/methylation domain-containing protein